MSYEITVITPDGRPTAEPVVADAATVRTLLDEAAATGTRLRISPHRTPAPEAAPAPPAATAPR